MTIKQSRYITAETEAQKKVRVTEVQKIDEDPYIRRSEVQQEINNSTLPVSSRSVKLAIESIEPPSLEGYATEEYVDAKVADIKPVDITQELGQSTSKVISQKVVTDGLGKKRDLNDFAFESGSFQILDRYPAVRLINTYIPSGDLGKEISLEGYRGDAVFIFRKYVGDRKEQTIVTIPSAKSGRVLTTSEESYVDKSGYLNTSKNPIATLTVSDMADTVVDNDLLTVTSGAVYRAIKQLTDQITSLEARIRELEDGGV